MFLLLLVVCCNGISLSQFCARYRIGGIFCREKISQILRFRKNYTQKTKIYMVHTLFLTDSRKFNPAKYTTYTVHCKLFFEVKIALLA